ncbi:RNase RNM [Flocculibacter collagenilyticus]|uniref:RNase RNM n=1 Tax=Flocculibacter collagenilyticus TaxID=2744479 RepID=UPI0018F785E5|nr:PHP domain-containing protein [Flocculibacter collagenilyticus]
MHQIYDLHSHTTHSDGNLTPIELIDRAIERGVNILAITDHDNISALPVGQEYVSNLQLPLTLINGVEISTSWTSFEIHIVGLNVDVNCEQFQQRLFTQREKREERAQEIGRRLAKAGIVNGYEEAKKLAGDAAISRTHFAKYLIQLGHAKSMQGVFKKYLGRGKTGYVPSQWIDIATAVQWIHDAGGVAVVAHPARYDMTAKWLRRLLIEFKNAGGDGMEVSQPQQALSERQQMAIYAKEYGLYASVGSDFHYPSPWTELGRNLYLPKGCEPIWTLFQH